MDLLDSTGQERTKMSEDGPTDGHDRLTNKVADRRGDGLPSYLYDLLLAGGGVLKQHRKTA